MNLLCPSCQKMLQVPDQFAGQQMRCPMCNSIFTVPGLAEQPVLPPAPPPLPAAAPPPPPPPLPGPSAPLPPPVPVSTEPAKSAPVPLLSTPEPVVGDYEKMKSIFISPNILPFITVGAVGLLFLLTFFPFGYSVKHIKRERADKESDPTSDTFVFAKAKELDNVYRFEKGNAWGLGFGTSGSVLYIVFDLFVVLCVLVAIAYLLIHLKVLPVPPQLASFRGMILGGLLAVSFIFQFMQQLINVFDVSLLPLSFFGFIAFWVHVIAIITVSLETWLHMRGPTRPPPRIDLHL